MEYLSRLGRRSLIALLRLGAPFGAMAVLTVRGRRTGMPRSTPIAVAPHRGGWRLLAVYGEADWVRNLRAAGKAILNFRGIDVPVVATEIEPDEAAPIIRSSLVSAGASTRRIIGRHFGARVDDPLAAWREEAARHPLFYLAPLELPERRGAGLLRGLATVLLVGLAGQVALAGLGAFGQLPWSVHGTFGVVIEALALVTAVAALVSRRVGVRWSLLGIFALITLQHGTATLGGWAGGLHALSALLQLSLAAMVVRRLGADVPIPAAPHLRVGEAEALSVAS
ncbi:MAG TPA: nitroreductase family deazaflavin-dependent oxidoreductase [Acidimicrobiia bacterium]